MAKPSNQGNDVNSTSNTAKSYFLDWFNNDAAANYGNWQYKVGSATSGYTALSSTLNLTNSNDFLYVNASVDNAGKVSSDPSLNDKIYDLASSFYANGGKGADQIIMKQDGADVRDEFFTNMMSFESFKLANGGGSTVALGGEALEAGVKDVAGGSGVDHIEFTSAYDTTSVVVNGGAEVDFIIAAGGGDRIIGGAGADVIDGGAGNDTYIYGAITDSNISTTTAAAAGFDQVTFTAGDTFDFAAVVAIVQATLVSAGVNLATDGTGALNQLQTAFLSSENAVADVEAAVITFSSGEQFLVVDTNADQQITAADQVIQLFGTVTGVSLNSGNVVIA